MGKLFLVFLFLLSIIWFGVEWTHRPAAPEIVRASDEMDIGRPPPMSESRRSVPTEYQMQAEESLPNE